MNNQSKILLVTTQLFNKGMSSKKIIFLNDFSKCYNSSNTDQSNHVTIEHPWLNERKKNFDEKYVEKLSYLFFDKLYQKLNELHKVNKNKKYWEILLLYWIYNYISFNLEKWRCIEKLLSRFNKNKLFTISINLKKKIEIENTYNYFEICKTDLYNHFIIQKMLKFNNFKNFIKKDFRQTDYPRNKEKINSISKVRKFLFHKILKFNTFYIDEVFSFRNYLKLCFFLRSFPFQINETDIFNNKYKKFNQNLRKKMNFEILTKNKFEKFLLENIINDIPKSLIENYKDIVFEIQNKLPKKKICYISGYNFWRNDVIKIWISEIRQNNSKLISIDHGGFLPVKNQFIYKFPPIVSDLYLTFYNKKNFDNKKKNILQIPRISKKKYSLPTFKKKDKILIVFNQFLRFRTNVNSFPIGKQNLFIIESIKKILNKIPNHVLKNIRFREKHENGWEYSKRLENHFGIKRKDLIFCNKRPIKKLVQSVKLCIVTYPDTVVLDFIDHDVPTILFVNKFWPIKRQYPQIFKQLKKAKILITSENELVSHLDNINNQPQKWWLEKKTQHAIRMVNKSLFAGNIDDNIYKLSNIIKNNFFINAKKEESQKR